MEQQWIDFKHVKAHASFEAILEHYGFEVQGRGDQRAILCPFHNETKPSCKINLKKRAFNCFGCDAHGNLLEFVQKMEDCDLREAAMLVAEWCGIDVAPEERAPRTETRKTKKKKKPASGTTDAPPPDAPAPTEPEPSNPPLTFELRLAPKHPYLEERGVSAELVHEFGLGFCSRGMMKGRICFPIHNEAGELVAYAGRWADADIPEDEEKYLLPPRFHKSRVLYNLHRVGKIEHLVIVESYWSVVRLHALGIPAVSPMGRSILEQQVRLLKRTGIPFLTLMLDGDEPGRTATNAALSLLSPAFFVHVAELPDGVKPHTAELATLEQLVWQP